MSGSCFYEWLFRAFKKCTPGHCVRFCVSFQRGAGMVQWWKRSTLTSVAWVRFLDSASYVGWVCCWFSFLLLKNQHFEIPIWSWWCPQLVLCARYRWHLNKVIYFLLLIVLGMLQVVNETQKQRRMRGGGVHARSVGFCVSFPPSMTMIVA